jgi:glycine cleavage system H protein
MNFPENLKYTKEHEWVSMDGGIATIGVTEFAQSELGDIVFVEIETEGETLNQDEVFGTIEAVKTVSDLFMPISGEIVAINTDLEDAPESVNESPYENGWMVKIKASDMSEIEGLMDADAYKSLIGQ